MFSCNAVSPNTTAAANEKFHADAPQSPAPRCTGGRQMPALNATS